MENVIRRVSGILLIMVGLWGFENIPNLRLALIYLGIIVLLLPILTQIMNKIKQFSSQTASLETEENHSSEYKTPTTKLIPSITAPKATAKSNIDPTKIKPVFLPDEITIKGNKFSKKYYYTDVKIVGSDFVQDKPIIERGDALILVPEPENQVDNKAIAIANEHGQKTGYVARGSLQNMIHDFMKRNEPIRALMLDSENLKMNIAFYKPYVDRFKELSIGDTIRKSFKLTSNTNEDMQDCISICDVGDQAEIDYDYEKEKYLVTSEVNIGYLPKSADDFIENLYEYEAFISDIQENENGKFSVKVTVFET